MCVCVSTIPQDPINGTVLINNAQLMRIDPVILGFFFQSRLRYDRKGPRDPSSGCDWPDKWSGVNPAPSIRNRRRWSRVACTSVSGYVRSKKEPLLCQQWNQEEEVKRASQASQEGHATVGFQWPIGDTLRSCQGSCCRSWRMLKRSLGVAKESVKESRKNPWSICV